MHLCKPLLVATFFGAASALFGVAPAPSAPTVKLTPLADRVRIEIGGQLFSEYVFKGADRAYLYPILAADGTQLVRDFPMKEVPGVEEDRDHPHHRGLWFAHSSVDGVDFWNEGAHGGAATPKGKIVHDALLETKSGEVATIRATNRWMSPAGKLICTDETTIRIRSTPTGPMVDYEIVWKALPDAPLLIGDNKDGTMAIRLAQWMTMPHKMKQPDGAMKETGANGHIVTAKDDRDKDAWGKRAPWCDYYAERGGKTYGVAFFDHPENLRSPTWWMARDYGLFGANPFGQHDFEMKKDQPHLGDYTLAAGQSLKLRYRFIFHQGDEKAAQIAARYVDYVAGK